MEISKEELLEYITSTICDNLHYDNLIDTCNIFENEMDITTEYGKGFTITIEIEENDDIEESDDLENE